MQAENANDLRQVLPEPDAATFLPWQAMLTDGRRWWVWQWPVNHDGSLAGGRLTDERAFVAGQDAEALAWLQSKTEPRFIRRIGRLYQPAGVTTVPCRMTAIGSPEQALRLILLAARPSGTWKIRTLSD